MHYLFAFSCFWMFISELESQIQSFFKAYHCVYFRWKAPNIMWPQSFRQIEAFVTKMMSRFIPAELFLSPSKSFFYCDCSTVGLRWCSITISSVLPLCLIRCSFQLHQMHFDCAANISWKYWIAGKSTGLDTVEKWDAVNVPLCCAANKLAKDSSCHLYLLGLF